jgi:phage major head subunit gpT-like protein
MKKSVFSVLIGVAMAVAVALVPAAAWAAVMPLGLGLAGAGVAVTPANLLALQKGYQKVFSDTMMALRAKDATAWRRVSMLVPSMSSSELYGWLADIGGIRKWLGDRVVKSLSAGGFEIVNDQFEETIGIKRTVIEDDKLGIYLPRVQQMAQNVDQFPHNNVFSLLKKADTTVCYDGQYLCDVDHPYVAADGSTQVQSNWGGGAGERWFLMCTSKMGAKPMIVQEREKFNFRAMTDLNSDHVFKKDEFLFGTDGRYGFGPGFWQLLYGSRQTLNTTAYEAARAAMLGFKRDGGDVLNITPELLVVGPSNEGAARRIVSSQLVNGGESNPWAGTAEVLVVPELG